MDKLTKDILKKLYTSQRTMTAEELGVFFDVSEKTIRNRILSCKKTVYRHGIEILSERGKGFSLNIYDEEKLLLWKGRKQKSFSEYTPDTKDGRYYKILTILLNATEYLTIDDLAEELYLSRNTVSTDLITVESILSKHNLLLQRKAPYGIKIMGEEYNKRLCLTNQQACFYDMQTLLKNDTLFAKIHDCTKDAFHQYGINASVNNFFLSCLYLTITLTRIARGFDCGHLGNTAVPERRNDLEKVCHYVNERSQLHLSESELSYYLLFLTSITNHMDSHSIVTVTREIDQLVVDMLVEVKNFLKIDLIGDWELRGFLSQHLLALDMRIKQAVFSENPMKDIVKSEYSLSYGVACCACNVINTHYGIELPDDEICFIAIIFALALERNLKKQKKCNVVIIYVSRQSSSRFFTYKFQKELGDYIHEIYECSITDLPHFDFAGKKIDYVFTTLDVELEVPVPVFHISLLPSDEELNKFRKLLIHGTGSVFSEYYREDLFIPCLKVTDKQEAIRSMCRVISEKYQVPDFFLDSVLEREAYGNTSFGQYVALPHPTATLTSENLVSVAVLEKPIRWGEETVKVIILVSLSNSAEEDSNDFIEVTSAFAANKNAVNQLVEHPSYDTLIEILEHLKGN